MEYESVYLVSSLDEAEDEPSLGTTKQGIPAPRHSYRQKGMQVQGRAMTDSSASEPGLEPSPPWPALTSPLPCAALPDKAGLFLPKGGGGCARTYLAVGHLVEILIGHVDLEGIDTCFKIKKSRKMHLRGKDMSFQ